MQRRVVFLCYRFVTAALVAGAAVAAVGGGASSAAAQEYSAWFGDDPPKTEAAQELRRRPHLHVRVARKESPRRARTSTDASIAPESKPAATTGPKLPLFAVVSIADQHISIYNHDGLVVRSAVSTGVPGHATPRGIYTIIGRERFHHSNIYSGAPMPFMQRVTWSGIAMHLGVVPGRPASHGCIRLPADFAARLWGMTRIGERVVISPQDVEPVAFTHPLLPSPKMRSSADAGKPAPEAGASPAPAPTRSPLVNPRQYAEQLKIKAIADATAAAKAVKEQSAALESLQQDAARAAVELRSAETAHAFARSRSEASEKSFATAVAAADAAKQKEVLVVAADINAARDGVVGKARAEGPSKAYERAAAFRDAAATVKANAATAVNDAVSKLEAVRTTYAAKSAQLADASRRLSDAKAAADAAAAARKEAERRTTPVSVLVSKKDGRIYVRQGLAVLFDAPVTVREPETPLGTHLYIATAPSEDGASLNWTALSPPAPMPQEPIERAKNRAVAANQSDFPVIGRRSASGPGEALERVEIAQDVRDRIAERLWTGGSIIISDQPPSVETGAEGTDLTVKLR